MIVRSAVLEGRVPEDRKAAFDDTMATAVVAAIRRYPGLIDVRLRRPVESEEGAPPVYMIFDLYFETLQAMKDALASPVRQEVRGVIAAGMKDFEGRVYHLVLEENR
ncbi:MAG: hypothetical protein ACRCU1_03815 [Alsobacter sp.]|jgi:hypothetical protein|nr:hypothetical protein [Burkholderiales bacterium]